MVPPVIRDYLTDLELTRMALEYLRCQIFIELVKAQTENTIIVLESLHDKLIQFCSENEIKLDTRGIKFDDTEDDIPNC